jgi:hypothetical protein
MSETSRTSFFQSTLLESKVHADTEARSKTTLEMVDKTQVESAKNLKEQIKRINLGAIVSGERTQKMRSPDHAKQTKIKKSVIETDFKRVISQVQQLNSTRASMYTKPKPEETQPDSARRVRIVSMTDRLFSPRLDKQR